MFSVVNYLPRFIDLCQGEMPELLISVRMLLLAIFMVTSYIMYPIEVISPGYLNFRRIVRIYIPWMILVGIYLLCEWLGIVFTPYGSLLDMLPHAARFEVWFRLLLALLIFSPVFTLFLIPYTRRYNNAGKEWMNRYILLFSVNCIAYIIVLTYDLIIVKTIYYYVSVGCSLGIAYMELFVRLIVKPASNDEAVETIYIKPPYIHQPYIAQPEDVLPFAEELHAAGSDQPVTAEATSFQSQSLLDRLKHYMILTSAYRDPDLSINSLSNALYTNRTTLAHTIRELGYESFTAYVNTLRIRDFIENVKTGKSDNFKNAFYDAGFRSRATAIRNFRQVTAMTPSEYFQNRYNAKKN